MSSSNRRAARFEPALPKRSEGADAALGAPEKPAEEQPAEEQPAAAAQSWSEALQDWKIPERIAEAAPEDPWELPPETFASAAQAALAGERRPFVRVALEALPEGGTVLDVGAGAGAASLPLVPPAGRVIAIDQSAAMLEAFAAAAGATPATAGATDASGSAGYFERRLVVGSWPEVADQVELADVVVCANVVYNVWELVPFLVALHDHARRRVVLELTWEHPQGELRGCWRSIHGIDRPERPTALDAALVAREAGFPAVLEQWEAPGRSAEERGARVLLACRQLCISTCRAAEVDRCLPDPLPPRRKATIWWDTQH